ncbi:hypothetical protein JVU11DRAFT_7300 [Chiua virens]|nr:hypothetical protein JVU11DRAFT_7300 [Chiua virens]
MSTNLVCLGCRQPFESTKSLSAHEGRCSKSHALSSNLFSKHYQTQTKVKAKGRKQEHPKHTATLSPGSSSRSSSSPSNSESQVLRSAAFADSVALQQGANDTVEELEEDEGNTQLEDWDMENEDDVEVCDLL